ncbi:hypothetical protein ID866_9332 [Astraeus odoratus]|nr:hypothetical protein ID866_9332 [Astraeus odoratus]
MRTRSPPAIYHAPPSPSNKAPPQKKLDSRSRLEDSGSLTPKATGPATPSEPAFQSSAGKSSKPVIDKESFQQILDLDDDGDRSFSRGMVNDYFDQAATTFKKMDDAFTKRDLAELSALGHFLKGSSATLGIARVQESCEKIQHLGNRTEPDKEPGPKEAKLSAEEALARIKSLLSRVKDDYEVAKKDLNAIYESSNP